MIQVFDNLLSDEELQDYLDRVSFARFGDVESQGIVYKDMTTDIPAQSIYKALESKMGLNTVNVVNFSRAYKDRLVPNPTWIHSDVRFAEYIAVFMAQSSNRPQDDGMAFWYNKELDDIQLYTTDHTGEDNKVVDAQTLDPEKWIQRSRIEYKTNRIVVAPASFFHSKTTYGNRGTNLKDCRIVHVLFFNKGTPDE